MLPAVALVANLTAVMHVVSPQFVGVNIDSASLYQGTLPHRLNFEDVGLKKAASVFANANENAEGVKTTFRLGGSSAEALSFGAVDGCQITMDPAYWDTIATFVKDANLTLAFDLNSGNAAMRKIVNGTNVWDSTNAELFLNYIAARPEQRAILGALQLGNEPGHTMAEATGLQFMTPEEHGKDYVALRNVIESTFKQGDRPLMQARCMHTMTHSV